MRQRIGVLNLSALCVVMALLTGLAYGQEKFGSFSGSASDPTGAVLPDVTVTVTNNESGRAISATSGADGSYFVRNIDPGRYSITFERDGFKLTEFPDVTLLVGQNLKLDPRMEVGGIQTTVEVTDTVPLIDTESTLVAHNIPAEEFNVLPKSRTFQYFAITSPSVNTGEIEGGIQVNGASGAENVFNIDGLNVNSIMHGHSRQNAPFEYLQEVQIKTGGIDAEYGGALGGVITAVTKSGGNQFHGEGHFYYSGDAISAAPVKRFVLDPRDERTIGYIQDDKNKEHNYEPGFSLGGPIRKDMLYFFTAWSPRWRQEDQTVRFSGAETDTFTRNQTYMSGFNKISFDPTSRIRSNFTFLWTPTQSDGTLIVYNGFGPNGTSQSLASQLSRKTTGFFSPQANYSGNIDFNLGSHAMLSVRGGRFWDNFKAIGVPDFSSVTYRTTSVGMENIPENLRQGAGFNNSPAIPSIKHDLTTHTNGQVDLLVSGNWGGQHNLKTGFGLQKNVNNVDNSYGGGGYVEIFWNQPFTSSPAKLADQRGTYGYYRVLQIGSLGSVGAGIKSFYAKDQWSIHRRLTLDLGIRSEQERIPSFQRNLRDFALDFGWGAKISPRLGASWDVTGNGKTKLYGSYGRFYDWTKYEVVRGQFGGNVQKLWFRSLDTFDVFSLSFTNKPGRDLWLGTGDSYRDDRIASFDRIDPDLKPMSQDSIVLGIDYQSDSQFVLGARYVHNNLVRTIEDVGTLLNGSSVFALANPGEGRLGEKNLRPDTATPIFDYPKAVRRYDALELTMTRRLSSGWFGNANYTWSRLFGNYPGVSNSDEIRTPTTGNAHGVTQQQGSSIYRPGNNASVAFDSDEILFDSKGNLDVQGRLATDRPHVFKFNGGYERAWGSLGSTNIGGFFYLGSGTPLSTEVNTTHNNAAYVNGRGDMGRTAILNYTDLAISHTFNVTEGQNLRIEWNMLNAFNQKTSRHRFVSLNRGILGSRTASTINLSNTNLYNGYDYKAMIANTADGQNAFDPRYDKDDLFNPGFSARLGIKWTF